MKICIRDDETHETLERRVHDLFLGNPGYLARTESHWEDYFVEEELKLLNQSLDVGHPVLRMIVSEAQKILEEIASKSACELRSKDSRYNQAFLVAETRYHAELFQPAYKAAVHVLELLGEQEADHDLAYAALSAVRGLGPHHPVEAAIVLERMYEKNRFLAAIIWGFCEISSLRAIDVYIEAYQRYKDVKDPEIDVTFSPH